MRREGREREGKEVRLTRFESRKALRDLNRRVVPSCKARITSERRMSEWTGKRDREEWGGRRDRTVDRLLRGRDRTRSSFDVGWLA